MMKLEDLLKRIQRLPAAGEFACFDLDFTLVKGDIAETTFLEVIEEGYLTQKSLPRCCQPLKFRSRTEHLFDYYERIKRIGYTYSAIWILRALSGLRVETVVECAKRTLTRNSPYRVGRRRVHLPPRPNPSVTDLFHYIRERGIKTYVISASYQIAVAVLCRKFFCLTPDRVIAIATGVRQKSGRMLSPYGTAPWSPTLKKALLTSKVIAPVPSQAGKVRAIRHHISNVRRPVVCVGDSKADFPMLSYCAPHGIAVFVGDGAKARLLKRHWSKTKNPAELYFLR